MNQQIGKKRRNCSSNGAPVFVQKLERILESPEYDDVVSWTRDGKAFAIKNVNAFTDNVLPAFFKHRNLSSFIRQLNMYSFGKIRSEEGEQVYANEHFQRDDKSNYKLIKRRVASEQEEGKNALAIASSSRSASNRSYVRDIEQLAQKQKEIEMVCLRLFKENQNMIAQNSQMWKKLSKRLEKKDKRVQKLLYFLLMNNNQIPIENGHELVSAIQATPRNNLMLYEESEQDSSEEPDQFDESAEQEDTEKAFNLPKINGVDLKSLLPLIVTKHGNAKLKNIMEALMDDKSLKKKKSFTIVEKDPTVDNLCIKQNGEGMSPKNKASENMMEQRNEPILEKPLAPLNNLEKSPPHDFGPVDDLLSDVNEYLGNYNDKDDQEAWTC